MDSKEFNVFKRSKLRQDFSKLLVGRGEDHHRSESPPEVAFDDGCNQSPGRVQLSS